MQREGTGISRVVKRKAMRRERKQVLAAACFMMNFSKKSLGWLYGNVFVSLFTYILFMVHIPFNIIHEIIDCQLE